MLRFEFWSRAKKLTDTLGPLHRAALTGHGRRALYIIWTGHWTSRSDSVKNVLRQQQGTWIDFSVHGAGTMAFQYPTGGPRLNGWSNVVETWSNVIQNKSNVRSKWVVQLGAMTVQSWSKGGPRMV